MNTRKRKAASKTKSPAKASSSSSSSSSRGGRGGRGAKKTKTSDKEEKKSDDEEDEEAVADGKKTPPLAQPTPTEPPSSQASTQPIKE